MLFLMICIHVNVVIVVPSLFSFINVSVKVLDGTCVVCLVSSLAFLFVSCKFVSFRFTVAFQGCKVVPPPVSKQYLCVPKTNAFSMLQNNKSAQSFRSRSVPEVIHSWKFPPTWIQHAHKGSIKHRKEVLGFIYPTGRCDVCGRSHNCIYLIVMLRFWFLFSSLSFLLSATTSMKEKGDYRSIPSGPWGPILFQTCLCVGGRERKSVGLFEGFRHSPPVTVKTPKTLIYTVYNVLSALPAVCMHVAVLLDASKPLWS